MNINKKLEVAQKAAEEAGVALLERFNKIAKGSQIDTEDKGYYDLKTEADEKAEKIILSAIKENFPEDTIKSEESGLNKGNQNIWFVDALDGTNNFSRGLALFGVTIGYVDQNKEMFGLIHYPVVNATTYGLSGEGSFANGELFKVDQSKGDKLDTINIIAGYKTPKEFEAKIISRFISKIGRLQSLWCPSVDSVLIAQGKTDAIISIENETYDQLPGLIIAKEAGCVVKTLDGEDFVLEKVEEFGDYLPILVIARNEGVYGQVRKGLEGIL